MIDTLITFAWTLAITGGVAAVLYFTKPLWQGYRTRVVSSVYSVLGVVVTADLQWLPDGIEGPLILASGILHALLRQWTTTPAGVKEGE